MGRITIEQMVNLTSRVKSNLETDGISLDKLEPFDQNINFRLGTRITDIRNYILMLINDGYISSDPKEVDLELKVQEDPVMTVGDLLTEMKTTAHTMALGNWRLIGMAMSQIDLGEYDDKEKEDFFQIGWLGLNEAAINYDPRKDKNRFQEPNKFSTYAFEYILGKIKSSRPDLNVINVPAYAYAERGQARRNKEHLTHILGRTPSEKEVNLWHFLAKELGRPPSDQELEENLRMLDPQDEHRFDRDKHRRFAKFSRRRRQVDGSFDVMSLDEERQISYSDERGESREYVVSLGETIDSIEEEYERIDRDLLRKNLIDALEVLTDREREVIELRYGLKDGQEHSFEAISKRFNVTDVRISQILDKGLRKLRHPARTRVLRRFLGD